ncbi:MAG: RHS domain-containing protein [Methylococcales bacterium]|nr:RHS domain-containing protein [Methylococcales bacterium]
MRLSRLSSVYPVITLSLITLLSVLSITFSTQSHAELTPICIEHYIRAGAVPQGPNVSWNVLLGECKIPASTANYGGLGSPRCGNRVDQIEAFCGASCPSTATPEDIASCFTPPPINSFQDNKSKGPSCDGVGNPCDPGSGNKFQQEGDYASYSGFLNLDRFYNSINPQDSIFGFGWTSSGLSQLNIVSDTEIEVINANGRGEVFKYVSNAWQGDSDSRLQLEKSSTEYTVTYQDTRVEIFNLSGQLIQQTDSSNLTTSFSYDTDNRLITITSPFTKTLSFVYGSNNHVQSVTTPDGPIAYQYNGLGNLTKVTYADDTSKTYHYEDANFVHHLTGITDENGKRFATWSYNSDGKATSSEHAVGVEKVTLLYDSSQNKTTVTGALGDTRTYDFELLQGVYKTTTINGDQCRTCGNGYIKGRSYDSNGFLTSFTDWKGNQTTLINNDRGLPTQQTDAVGTAEERTTTTVWHNDFSLPVTITEPNKKTDLSYNDSGQLLSRTVTDLNNNEFRTTTYTYNSQGLIATIDDSRTDVSDITTFEYDAKGNRIKITNALGQITQITAYDPSGRPLTIVDPNGAITELSYDLRGRLTNQITEGNSTRLSYDPAGNIKQIKQATGQVLNYSYDDAHRLTGYSDALGNQIAYTLDAAGNKLSETIAGSNQTLTQTHQFVYDKLSHLVSDIGAANQTANFQYDANNNLIQQTDPNRNISKFGFDALNRLINTTDANNGQSLYQYDTRDNLTRVTDPNGHHTSYRYNAFDNLLEKNSPDTGITTYTVDSAGNRLSQTDAKGILTTYTYDALNRLTSVNYPDSNLNISYQFDENAAGQNGIGRLTTMTDASGTTKYHYDKRGNLTSETTSRGTATVSIQYAYNIGDQLDQITYPSGRTVDYFYDTVGRIEKVTTTDALGITQTLASDLRYQPFGNVNKLVYGNGLSSQYSFDLDARLTEINLSPVHDWQYSYDPVSNITGITNSLDLNQDKTYGYDSLNRLIDAQGNNSNQSYQYDSTGNRTLHTQDNSSNNYHYSTTNHHLKDINGSQFNYDANGNITQLSHSTISTALVYGDNNRLSQVNGVIYTYNGNGERVLKNKNGSITGYYYNQNGQLIAETDGASQIDKEYLYLDGQLIALVTQPTNTNISNTCDVTKTISKNEWLLIGIPCTAPQTANTMEAILADDVTGTYGTDWRVYEYNPVSKSYDQVNLQDVLQVGKGYWIISANDSAVLDMPTGSLPVNQTSSAQCTSPTCFEAKITSNNSTQWQLLANPFQHTYKWSELRGKVATGNSLCNDSDGCTLAEMESAGFVQDQGWYYDNNNYVKLKNTTISPWTGMWMVAHETASSDHAPTLLFPGKAPLEITNGDQAQAVYYVHNDHLGTPQAITDENQVIVWQAEYDPFGKATIITETVTNNVRFPGQYFDSETGLHYNYYRYYDPSTGRYVTSDPIGLSGGLNTYGYTLNNPMNFIDIFGLSPNSNAMADYFDPIKKAIKESEGSVYFDPKKEAIKFGVYSSVDAVTGFKTPNPEVPSILDIIVLGNTINNMKNDFINKKPVSGMDRFYRFVFGDFFADGMKPFSESFFYWNESLKPLPSPKPKQETPLPEKCTNYPNLGTY